MSELNESVQVTVDDATVITVPLVTNLTATNAAPTAKTVGDALASKVDTEHIMESVTIKVNDETSDNQGQILIDATGIPISEGSTTSIKDAVDAVDAKTASDITYEGTGPSAVSIKTKVDGINTTLGTVNAKTANEITYDATAATPVTIKAKVDALATVVAGIDTGTDNVKYTAQTGFDATQKGVARNNIGAAAASDVTAIQTEMSGKFPTTIPYEVLNLSDDYPIPLVDLGLAARATNSCALIRFGPIALVTFCFTTTAAVSAGAKVAGFYGGYEIAANELPIAQLSANSGISIPLYRDGDGVATPVGLTENTFYRGFILYGLNNSIWPIATTAAST